MKILLDWRTYVISVVIISSLFFGVYLKLNFKESNDLEVKIVKESKEVSEISEIKKVDEKKQLEELSIDFSLILGSKISAIQNEILKINNLDFNTISEVNKEKINKYKIELEKINTFEKQKPLLLNHYKGIYGELNSENINLDFIDRYDNELPNGFIFDNTLVNINYEFKSANQNINQILEEELVKIEKEYKFTKKKFEIKFVYVKDNDNESDGIFYKFDFTNDLYTSVLVDLPNNKIYLSGYYIDENSYKDSIHNSIVLLVKNNYLKDNAKLNVDEELVYRKDVLDNIIK